MKTGTTKASALRQPSLHQALFCYLEYSEYIALHVAVCDGLQALVNSIGCRVTVRVRDQQLDGYDHSVQVTLENVCFPILLRFTDTVHYRCTVLSGFNSNTVLSERLLMCRWPDSAHTQRYTKQFEHIRVFYQIMSLVLGLARHSNALHMSTCRPFTYRSVRSYLQCVDTYTLPAVTAGNLNQSKRRRPSFFSLLSNDV